MYERRCSIDSFNVPVLPNYYFLFSSGTSPYGHRYENGVMTTPSRSILPALIFTSLYFGQNKLSVMF